MPALSVGERVDVIVNVRVAGPGRGLVAHPGTERDGVVDVHLADGRIVDIAPRGALRTRGAVLEGEGSWILPGLWDHHAHLVQWALARTRASLSDASTAEQAAAMAAMVGPRSDGRRVAMRLRDGGFLAVPTIEQLDAATGDVPSYLVCSDLHGIWMNSAAFRLEGLTPTIDGFVREEAAFTLGSMLGEVPPADQARAIDDALLAASARGVVGIADLEIGWNAPRWHERVERGHDGMRVQFNVYPDDLDRAIDAEFVTGAPIDRRGLVQIGRLKIISDGSLGSRTAATSVAYGGAGHAHHFGALNVEPAEARDLVFRAAGAGIASTIHAIGDVAVTHALDTFTALDLAGRIEHAQLIAPSDLARFARIGVEASVQPEHALDDRDLVGRYWQTQSATPYPMRELIDAGVNVLFGSDAPVAALDPWRAIAAAVNRAFPGEDAWRPWQCLTAVEAIAASTASGSLDPRGVIPGHVADVVLVADDPESGAPERLWDVGVRATIVDQRLSFIE